jgi:GT2 family glycosyltransferase
VRVSAVIPATNGPSTLSRSVVALESAAEPPDEIVVVDRPSHAGPGEARNLGVRRASGEVVLFVDSDVLVHHDAVARVRLALAEDPGLAAVFGAYDTTPEAPGVVSVFRNLLPHHVHSGAAGPCNSFWAGLGAVRREPFLELGGFDERRYPTASIEDIELGLRLTENGLRIELDPLIRGTHLKRWTLGRMIATDFWRRGVPWTALLMEHGWGRGNLNLEMRHRVSAAAAALAVGAATTRKPGRLLAAGGTIVWLNRDFYALLYRSRGPWQAVAGVGLHAVHHLTGAAAASTGAVWYLLESRRSPQHAATPSSNGRAGRFQRGRGDGVSGRLPAQVREGGSHGEHDR